MSHAFDPDAEAQALLDFVDASPTPFHAAENAARALAGAGFRRLEEREPFPSGPGRYVFLRGGSLVAWTEPPHARPITPFRIVGAHTDSPTLRIKPRPDHVKAGWQMLGVEPYGGTLLNSWLDRDLGLAGRVVVRGGDGPRTRLFHDRTPLLRVAQLAIHLDRGVNDGLVLNRQTHLTPLWGLGDEPASFAAYLGDQVHVAPEDVLGWDAMVHDVQPSRRLGRGQELLAAPRLDNQATVSAGVRALAAVSRGELAQRAVLVLFDHEEVGSATERGAESPLLPAAVERIVAASSGVGGTRQDVWRALADSVVLSGDMAHAVHPNYPERHEPLHPVAVNGGPVLKVNADARYATDGLGVAYLRTACEQAQVPLQTFVTRSDLPCGSTIGPVTAARLGVTTVDAGTAMLSMHSARELAGAKDPAMYAAMLAAFLAPA